MKIHKKIKFQEDSDYFLTIMLTSEDDNLGDFEIISQDDSQITSNKNRVTTPNNQITNNVPNNRFSYSLPNNYSYTVTGITESRLNEIRLPLEGNQFINNPNIILQQGSDFIRYRLDGVTYRTQLNDNEDTTFSIQKTFSRSSPITEFLVKNQEFILYNGKPKVENNVNIDRNNISIIKAHESMKQINNLFELLNYGGSSFNIFDE